ncbi:MAG: DsbA family protein [Alphaproteobacteria bacterium]
MPEPKKNPNASLIVDPPGWFRHLTAWMMRDVTDSARLTRQRERFEAKRKGRNEPHTVHYFHQLDDPYSHLTAQVLQRFAQRYDIVVRTHLIRASGGANQPELEKLQIWARRDAERIAPHLGLSFPAHAGTLADPDLTMQAARILVTLPDHDFIARIDGISTALWSGHDAPLRGADVPLASDDEARSALEAGSALLKEMGHYSGACFYYGGEWYWGVDRLFHLELRLRELGVCHNADTPLLAPRPPIDVTGVDASALTLDFFPSLNSPYTSIIFDRTIALKEECGVQFNHKPVLPMIMRGVPATRAKARYILFDTKREADFFGVPFGKLIMPVGTPTRRAYSLLGWAKSLGKDERLMSSLLRNAFADGTGLHTEKGMRRAIEAAGLDWTMARPIIGNEDWQPVIEENQREMIEDLGLWGVPSYRLSGPAGEPDLAVWGQDRLWLIAAEIRRRAGSHNPPAP